jgi:hypothetical protein
MPTNSIKHFSTNINERDLAILALLNANGKQIFVFCLMETVTVYCEN